MIDKEQEIIEGVDLIDSISKDRPDHHIWLSFNNDSGAELFYYWWNTEGHDFYQKYCADHQYEAL